MHFSIFVFSKYFSVGLSFKEPSDFFKNLKLILSSIECDQYLFNRSISGKIVSFFPQLSIKNIIFYYNILDAVVEPLSGGSSFLEF
ncbi:MAG: hypothetical protein C4545_03720 [Anaerolineaceae bacterium]|nr:MAG: hypothetical protein C4545_03720 [Anaerolineaceae bacterium]